MNSALQDLSYYQPSAACSAKRSQPYHNPADLDSGKTRRFVEESFVENSQSSLQVE